MQITWNQETLDQLRHVMDQDADTAITSVYQSKSNEQLRNTLMEIASNDSFALQKHFSGLEGSESLYNLVENELSQKFSDNDIAMFNRTYEIWKENGVRFIYILFFRALPFTYAAEKPANVLRMTKLIETQATRRIFETAQFVFDVMDKNWWGPAQRGIITSVKIRLMHAAMRYMLLKNETGEKWDATQWGMPISQEDLIATNQVFSLEFFKGMGMLGDQLSAADQEAWFHTWKVIGRIMGIQEDLLMPTIPEAWELQTAVYIHLFKDSHASGVGLAKALVEALGHFMLPTKLTLLVMQKMMHDEAFPDVFNNLLGPSYADVYGNIFRKNNTTNDEALDKELIADFYDELKNFHGAVTDFREKEKQTQALNGATDAEERKSLIDFQLEEFTKIFGDIENSSWASVIGRDLNKVKERLIGDFTNILDKIEKKEEKLSARLGIKEDEEKIKADFVKKAMNAISNVIIELLSKYFRQGKMAGFRIDADLKEHWKIK